MTEDPNEKLINFLVDKQRGGCGYHDEEEEMESLADHIINFTVGKLSDTIVKECKILLQMSIENGANLIMIALEMEVPREKLLEYYDEKFIKYWEIEFLKAKDKDKNKPGEEGE